MTLRSTETNQEKGYVMLRVLSTFLYVAVLLPIWAVRHTFGISRFERRFHARESTWDQQRRNAMDKE